MTAAGPARDPAHRHPASRSDVEVWTAVAARLRLVADALGAPGAADAADAVRGTDPYGLAHDATSGLARHVATTGDRAELWLLLVAVTGAFPDPATVDEVRRALRLDPAEQVALELLERARSSPRRRLAARMVLVRDRPVVDVDFTARHDLHTGIQRVVRETLPRWTRPHVLTAWEDSDDAYRELTPTERDRVLRFRHGRAADARRTAARQAEASGSPLVVPWRTVVVLPEVPRTAVAERLRAMTEANAVVAVGYDCIPVVSADTLPAAEPVKFVRYLAMLKHARLVVAISDAAAEEFRGFVDMLPSQGLPGPTVTACPLPAQVPRSRTAAGAAGTAVPPQVLAVGSHDPRKNHLAVLHAAERLWDEGHRFTLVFVGGPGWRSEPFDAEVRRLARSGRPVRTARTVADEELWTLYGSSRFTVFPSLHEGFGLPVAESLATGVPAVTSDRGSTADIARGGGALTVDPLDDDAMVAAMRRLLTDDALLAELSAAARARPSRSWDEYAGELWDLVAAVSP